MQPLGWMRVAGLATWCVAVLPTALAAGRGELGVTRVIAFAAAALAFLIAFAIACRTPASLLARLAQSVAALAMVWFGRDVVTAAILVVVASQLSGAVSNRVAIAWIAVQTAVLAWRFDAPHAGFALANCAAFAGFQAFALAAGSLVENERRARAAAAEHARTALRLQVARDLHDALGHHLTALGMQLEVAVRLCDGPAKEHVEAAQSIGRLLLAEVRNTVSDLRDPRPLGAALRALVVSAPLAIHLELAPELDALTGDPAEAIVRCAQEAFTNSARHAGAKHLSLAITADRTRIQITARDDGSSSGPITFGHGLSGMRERFTALGGTVEARRMTSGGFEIIATLRRP